MAQQGCSTAGESKDSPRPSAYGEVDEAQAIGLARAQIAKGSDLDNY